MRGLEVEGLEHGALRGPVGGHRHLRPTPADADRGRIGGYRRTRDWRVRDLRGLEGIDG